jgi:RES domain-containing protein
MIVYRVGRSKHAKDLSGEGARLHGGRWNHKLTACIYTSQSRALAVLEYTVNVNIDDLPRSLSITTIEIPDKDIQIINIAGLPGNWNIVPAPYSAKDFGTSLLMAAASAIIRYPSSVIPDEFNFILNPVHPASKNFAILDTRDFVYDVRIKMA